MLIAARLSNLLGAAARLAEDAVEQSLLRELPYGPSAPAALTSIAHRPGLSIEWLRRVLGLTHSGTVRLVDRLEGAGLVIREQTEGRTVPLALTPRGRRTLARVERARIAALQALLEPLPQEAREQLDSLLSALLAAQTETNDDLYRICRLCSFDACQRERPCPVAQAVDI